jgi:tRNA(adenine34) deaminase
MDDESFMRQALVNAGHAFELNEVPVGAVLVYQGKIIAESHNRVEKFQDATCHAEMGCIQQGQKIFNNWRLTDCILYTTLEPCLMCYGAAVLSRIKKIVYGASDLRHGACGGCFDIHNQPHPIHHVELQGGILLEPSKELLKNFFKKMRNIKNGP